MDQTNTSKCGEHNMGVKEYQILVLKKEYKK
jgi:hypothetical protein